jgi:hypothetical protein
MQQTRKACVFRLSYEKALFLWKLDEIGWRIVPADHQWIGGVVFSRRPPPGADITAGNTAGVGSNPDARALQLRGLFQADDDLSDGIQDARFVRFEDCDGSAMYYATFTAYDGKIITSALVKALVFMRFRFITLDGPAAQNKGMALFPRKSALCC